MSEPDAVSQIEAILLDEIDLAGDEGAAYIKATVRLIARRICRVIDPAREQSGGS